MQRGNGLKRTGFKPKTYERAPRQVLQPISPEVTARVSMPRADGMTGAVEKTEQERNARLLRLAKGKPCLFRLACCDGGGASTVAAHSNHAQHGKAGARKAQDFFSAWACFHCHVAYDQGCAPRDEKRAWFDAAHKAQITQWQSIASAQGEADADRKAARWALEKLGVQCS